MNPPPARHPAPLLERRWLIVTVLTLVLLAGGWLAARRIFQVDEIQTMHMAWLLTQPDAGHYFNSAEIYLIPMAALCRIVGDPIAYMIACRFLFLALLAAGCVVLARAVSRDSRHKYSTALVLLAGTPILWDFGFEVRHDNVVIPGLALLILILFSRPADRTWRLLYLGGLVGGTLFLSSFKSIVLWVPILGYTVLLFALRDRMSLLRVFAAAAGGAASALVIGLAGHLLSGSLPLYLKTLQAVFGSVGAESIRFFDMDTLRRFVCTHPWIVSLGLLFFTLNIFKVGKNLLTLEAFRRDDPQAKRLLLLVLGPLFLILNPTPFPYNYLYIAVLAFPAVFFLTDQALNGSSIRKGVIVPALLLLHFLPGIVQGVRHFKFDNRAQREIVAYANRFTEPEQCVFDGAGLAMFRRGPGKMWYLHSLNRAGYLSGAFPSVRDMLTRSGCPLLIQSYKWNFMQEDDLAFIRSRYVPFRGVIWILGRGLLRDTPGESRFEIHRDGWYTVGTRTGEPLPALKIDGAAVFSRPVFLHRGPHVLENPDPGTGVFILWTRGENKTALPVPEVFQPVFVNWY